MNMPRLKPVSSDPAQLNPAQRRVFEAIASGPRKQVRGPFPYLLNSPEACDCIQRLGGYLRYNAPVSGRFGELIVLVTARYWDCHYEWSIHVEIARKEGVPENVIAEIKSGRRPASDPDAALIHDVAHALYEDYKIPDELYEKAVKRLGEQALLDMVVMIGYYAMLAQVFAAFEVMPAAGTENLKG
jgi:4-carboxymuconolactone decarboxylase